MANKETRYIKVCEKPDGTTYVDYLGKDVITRTCIVLNSTNSLDYYECELFIDTLDKCVSNTYYYDCDWNFISKNFVEETIYYRVVYKRDPDDILAPRWTPVERIRLSKIQMKFDEYCTYYYNYVNSKLTTIVKIINMPKLKEQSILSVDDDWRTEYDSIPVPPEHVSIATNTEKFTD